MIKISNKLKVYLYSSLILTALAIVLCSLSYVFSFDATVGYFNSNTPLPYILSALCLLALLWFLSSLFMIPKNVLDGASPTTITVNIAATPICICSLLLGSLMIISYFFILSGNTIGDLFFGFAGEKTLLLIACGIFLVIAAIYFTILWFTQDSYGEINALVGFSVPFACILLVAIAYFDLFVTMNSPVKIGFQLAMISFMIFFLFELRVALGKAKPRAYFFFAMTAMLVSGIASIPQIIAFIAGKLNNTTYLLYAVFSLCVFVYTLSRLCIFVSARSLLERISDQTPTEDEEAEQDNL